MSLTRWFKVVDASVTSKSDEGALKEAKIAVEEVERVGEDGRTLEYYINKVVTN